MLEGGDEEREEEELLQRSCEAGAAAAAAAGAAVAAAASAAGAAQHGGGARAAGFGGRAVDESDDVIKAAITAAARGGGQAEEDEAAARASLLGGGKLGGGGTDDAGPSASGSASSSNLARSRLGPSSRSGSKSAVSGCCWVGRALMVGGMRVSFLVGCCRRRHTRSNNKKKTRTTVKQGQRAANAGRRQSKVPSYIMLPDGQARSVWIQLQLVVAMYIIWVTPIRVVRAMVFAAGGVEGVVGVGDVGGREGRGRVRTLFLCSFSAAPNASVALAHRASTCRPRAAGSGWRG